MRNKFSILFSMIISATILISAQSLKRDTAVFIEKKNEFFDSVRTSLDAFYKKDA